VCVSLNFLEDLYNHLAVCVFFTVVKQSCLYNTIFCLSTIMFYEAYEVTLLFVSPLLFLLTEALYIMRFLSM
jgi:hypothetical protein